MPKQPQMPNMQQMLAQEQLKSELVEASAGGGMVRVTMTGDLKVKEVNIDPDAVDPQDVEILSEMVLAAINEALVKAQELQTSRLNGATGGLDLGALGGGLGGLGLPGL
jgi:DNA-binding YbaB/EbfC family protein